MSPEEETVDMAIDKEPILITGAARSGTSMCAGIIYKCGAWGGQLAGPTKYNRRGMYENSEIRNNVVKPFFDRNGWDRLGQNPLPEIEEIKNSLNLDLLAANLRKDVLNIIRRQGYRKGIWFYKGAKMCLVWPIWHHAFPKARWIVVRREPMDIVNSCMRTPFMRSFKRQSGWLWWVAEHEKRFDEMHDAKLDIQEIWPQQIVEGDVRSIQSVVNRLGLEWNFDAVREFVEPSLWHRNKRRK